MFKVNKESARVSRQPFVYVASRHCDILTIHEYLHICQAAESKGMHKHFHFFELPSHHIHTVRCTTLMIVQSFYKDGA